MRNVYIFIGILFLLITGACSDDKDILPQVKPSADGDFVDERDGNTYHWVRYGNLEWMVKNIKIESTEGVCQIYSEIQVTPEEREEQEMKNLQKYGYLYDYEAAKAAVPDGWRIPTDEDWQNLEKIMGMAEKDVVEFGWRGKQEGKMLQQKECVWLRPGGFMNYEKGQIGANYTPDYVGFYGFFWSSTKDGDKVDAMIYRQIRYNSSQIGRFSTLPQKLLSLRCVRDVSK